MTSQRIRWHRPLLVLSFAMALLAVIAVTVLTVGLGVAIIGLDLLTMPLPSHRRRSAYPGTGTSNK